jgi:CRP-like cAMP-binding protein
MIADSKFKFPEGKAPMKNNTIVSVLQKPNDKRTQDETELLVALIKNLEFFQTRDIRDKNYPEIVSWLKLEKMACDQVVFNINDEGKHFYVIISGIVSVLIPNKKKFDNIKKLTIEVNQFLKFKPKTFKNKNTLEKNSHNESVLATQSDWDPEGEGEESIEMKDHNENNEDLIRQTINRAQSNASFHSNTKSRMNDENRSSAGSRINIDSSEGLNPVQRLEIWESEPDFICVAKITSGDSFGELALLDDKPRSATIQWYSDWVFATMEREDYNKTLKRIENRNINKIVDFFQDLPYFSTYGKNALQRIRFLFNRFKLKGKHVVFKEGDPSDYVYIVISGDFELIKKVKQVETKEINFKNYLRSNIFNGVDSNAKVVKSEVDEKIAKFTNNKALSNNNEYSQNYRIALMCKGQMFGDQDVFYGKPYQSTVIWRSSAGELYKISRENFQKLKNIGDWWQKITSKYITQEHLHYRLLKNQQKFNSEASSHKKKPAKTVKNSTPYTLIAEKSPLLRTTMSKLLYFTV